MTGLPSGTVTFLFTDLEGSTRLWEEHPDAMRDALARHDEILRAAIEAHGGHVVKTTGDGVHAVFATARRRDGARRSTRSARSAPSRGSETGPLRVRMGVHTGEARAARRRLFRPGVEPGGAARWRRRTAVRSSCSHADRGPGRATRCPRVLDWSIWASIGCGTCRRPERVFQVRASGADAATFPPLRSLDAFPGNLPVQLTSFVGRDDDVAGVAKALDRVAAGHA